MKKFFLICFFYFLLQSVSNACSTYDQAKDRPYNCSYNELNELLNFYKNNMFAEYTLPKGVSLKNAQKLIKKRIKEKKDYFEYRCNLIAGKANNAWSARKIYKSCLKQKLN